MNVLTSNYKGSQYKELVSSQASNSRNDDRIITNDKKRELISRMNHLWGE